MINVGIIGHTGRTGKTLVEVLTKHPYAKIVYTESRQEGKQGNLEDSDTVFLHLPKGESKTYLPNLENKKIIDLSGDHRLNPGWIYGLPEKILWTGAGPFYQKDEIKKAIKVANPGCYATSILLGIIPIKDELSDICIASTSGISGAGLEPTKEDNFLIYNNGQCHPHLAEIYLPLDTLFVPQRIDTADRGIITTIFAKYKGKQDLTYYYKKYYESMHFIRIKDHIQTKEVLGTNYIDIIIDRYPGNKVIIISALDNLMKGGAGQAVQNFNLMHGLDETTGLL